MPGSTFAGREEWEVNDMLFRLEEIIVYSRDYLLTTTYPDGPSEQMKNKNPEEYKKMQKDNQFTVSLTRDLMACVDIFKKIPYPKNKEAEALKACEQNHDKKTPRRKTNSRKLND